jgi:hypothetical protein
VLNRRIFKVIVPSLLFVSAAVSVSCSATTNRDVADAAVTKFHANLDREQYDLIFMEAASEFKGNREDTVSFLKEVREILGKVVAAQGAASSVHNIGGEAQVTLSYLTQFQNGQGAETFIYRVKDQKASLVFYDVKAPGIRNRD